MNPKNYTSIALALMFCSTHATANGVDLNIDVIQLKTNNIGSLSHSPINSWLVSRPSFSVPSNGQELTIGFWNSAMHSAYIQHNWKNSDSDYIANFALINTPIWPNPRAIGSNLTLSF